MMKHRYDLLFFLQTDEQLEGLHDLLYSNEYGVSLDE